MKLQFMEQLKNSRFAQNTQKVLSSPFFVVAIFCMTFILSVFKLTVPSFIILGLLIAFVFVTQKDIKPIIVLVLNCILSLTQNLVLSNIDKIALLICVCIVFLSLIYYFVCSFAVEKKKFVFGKLFWGLVAVTIVGAGLAGLLATDYEHIYSLRFLGIMCVILLLYILLVNGTDESVKDYTAFAFMCFGVVACFQVIVFYATCGDPVLAFHQKALRIGWGMTNTIAPALGLCIPATIYLATKKFPQIYLPIAILMYITVLFTFSRAGMLCSTIILPFALIYGFLVTKNRLHYGITLLTLVFVCGGVFVGCLQKGKIDDWFSLTKSLGFDDNGRFEVWKYGWEDFKRNKIFGAGFYGEDGIELVGPLKKYHNTILQILACSGIVGAVAFVFHYYQRYKLMFTKLSVCKAFWLFSLAIYEGCAMLDVGMVMFFIQMMLVFVFTSCEKETAKTYVPAISVIYKGRKTMDNKDIENSIEEKNVEETGETQKKNEVDEVVENKEVNEVEDANGVEEPNISLSETSAETKELVKKIEETNAGQLTENKSENAKGKEQTLTEAKSDKELTRKHKFYRYFLKRFFDITLSLIAMIILSPVYLVVSILVKIKLGSPIIFKQLRPGYKNKIFKFYKYRSMLNATDANGDPLPDEQRMTKFGKLLRKTSLDELPQLWNIFKGDMSFVGPRPKLVKDMVFYNNQQNQRSLVRPGLTGYAQANGRNLNTWNETFNYDLYYVEHCSLWLDIKILFKTALKVIKKDEILTQEQVPDAYYFGDQLLKTNQITEEEYKSKLITAKEIEKKVMEK